MDKKPRILICDDEELIRWSLSEYLHEEGYREVEAADLSRARCAGCHQDHCQLGRRAAGVQAFDLRGNDPCPYGIRSG